MTFSNDTVVLSGPGLSVRRATSASVVVVGAIAAYVSYLHMHAVALRYGEDRVTAAVIPVSVDGLILAASMTLLGDSRAGRRRGWLSSVLLSVGCAASLAANMLHADATVVARLIAAWPAVALIGSYELLMRQIRQAAVPAPVPVPVPVAGPVRTGTAGRKPASAPGRTGTGQAGRSRVRAAAFRLLAEHHERTAETLSGPQLGARLRAAGCEVTDSYVRRCIREWRQGRAAASGAAAA